MNKNEVFSMQFTTYLKQCARTGVIIGVLFGIMLFVFTLFNGDTSIEFFNHEFTGLWGGIIILILIPVQFGLFGVIWSILSFLLYKLIEKITGKLLG